MSFVTHPEQTFQHLTQCKAYTCSCQVQSFQHQGALVLPGLSSLPHSAGHHWGLTGTTVTCCPSNCTCSGGALPSTAARAGNSLMYAMPRSPTCDVNVPAPFLLLLVAAGLLLPAAGATMGNGHGRSAEAAQKERTPATLCHMYFPTHFPTPTSTDLTDFSCKLLRPSWCNDAH
jgi:hypothetical protein